MEYQNEDQGLNWWKIIAVILIVIGLGVGGYFGYIAVRADGYTKGFNDGSNYVVAYQTQNSKIFLVNQTGSPLELNYQQLCAAVQNG